MSKDIVFELDLKSPVQVFLKNEYEYVLANMHKLERLEGRVENFVNEEIGIVDAPEVEYIYVYKIKQGEVLVPGCYVDKSKNICYMVL